MVILEREFNERSRTIAHAQGVTHICHVKVPTCLYSSDNEMRRVLLPSNGIMIDFMGPLPPQSAIRSLLMSRSPKLLYCKLTCTMNPAEIGGKAHTSTGKSTLG